MRAIAVLAPASADYTMHSKGEIKNQQDAVAKGKPGMKTALGKAVRGQGGAYRVEHRGVRVLRVP